LNYPLLWLVLLIIFAGVEGITAGLVSIWFCAGSLAALLAALLKVSVGWQVAIFCGVSLVAMALIRPMAKKLMKVKITKTNADRILEQQALVVETINNLTASGQVKVGGILWTARSKDGSVIPEGAMVQVKAIEGVKAIVTPLQEGEEHE